MDININIEVLKENNLGVAAYTSLFLIWKDRHDLILQICESVDFDALEEQGWMKRNGDSIKDWVVRGKFLGLVTTKDNLLWYQLCSKLPFKVPNGVGGSRVLRAKDPDAKTNEKARKRYIKLVRGNPELHKKILKCVDAQLKEMRGKEQFLQNTDTWILNRTWEKYEHLISNNIESNNERKDSGYGNKII